MGSRIKQFFLRRYFGDDLPFEYRLYMIFFIEALVLSVLSATTNTLLGKGIWGLVFQWVFIAFMVFLLAAPMRLRTITARPLLLFTAFVYIPFLFFQTAGYDGTAGLFALVAVLMMTVQFSGQMRIALVILSVAEWVTLCVVQFVRPDLVVYHAGEQANFIDYVVATILTMSSIAILGIYYRNQFNREADRILRLNSRLASNNKLLEEMAINDPLTDIYNRRYISLRLDNALLDVDRLDDGIFLMMLDLDYFKNINDVYGHQVGDSVLVRFAATVREAIRERDIVARYGGEEFLVVLYGSNAQQAHQIAERIRHAVSEMTFSEQFKLTVSIGVAMARPGDGSTSLIAKADECMYLAKLRGRNRIVMENDLD